MDISQANSEGTLIQSTSNMVTSQDFQGIHIDSNPRNAPDRIIFNFGESCKSSNTTIDTIQQLNNNSISAAAIQYAQKIALVKRGNCNWSEKMSVVNSLALSHNINITAMFIYDNDTHHDNNITIARKPVVGSGSIGPPNYSVPLPAYRSVLNMTDNDLGMTSPSTTVVYFVPNAYGTTWVDRISQSYNSSLPNMRIFWLITPYLEEVSWGYAGEDGFFSTGKGYLSYIIALAAIFLIVGVIFLRWWRIRRMRADYPNGFTGFQAGNGLPMQPRTTHLDPLPVDIVNALPIEKYSPDLIKNINCAICLEDFVTGKNDIRILPCGHGFCVLCIDPWLTQKSTMCPICKWDCLPTDLRRERNQQQREQQQQQSNQENLNPTVTINMSSSSGPSTTSTPAETHHTENTVRAPGRIIPPPILPASSPPPSPSIPSQNYTVHLSENPFEHGGNDTTITHAPSHHINMFDHDKETDNLNDKSHVNPFDVSSSNVSESQSNHSVESVMVEDNNEKEAPRKDQC
ncbi:hypothetical protein [Parasitella parasitica]|uniref:RING-type domain-containing protein n=1 Tax=Parasitella parasitica TaxID=35722 RepID=A0A0B7MYK9_9FUNG|nr:hypothetical protein [Parasitella parasitica]